MGRGGEGEEEAEGEGEGMREERGREGEEGSGGERRGEEGWEGREGGEERRGWHYALVHTARCGSTGSVGSSVNQKVLLLSTVPQEANMLGAHRQSGQCSVCHWRTPLLADKQLASTLSEEREGDSPTAQTSCGASTSAPCVQVEIKAHYGSTSECGGAPDLIAMEPEPQSAKLCHTGYHAMNFPVQ